MNARCLWLDPSRRAHMLEAYRAAEPWIAPLASTASGRADTDAQSGSEPAAIIRLALDACLNANQARASAAKELWCEAARAALVSEDLHKAHLALVGAAMTDCLVDIWTDAQRVAVARSMRELMGSFFDISPGNPHAVGNNWWAVTHSGIFCLAAALQALGDMEPIRGRTPMEIEEWSWGRLRAFLRHFGPAGAFHEGLGYMGYTCANLLPAAHLRMARSGDDVVSACSGLARMASLIFCAAIEGREFSDETNSRGSWGRMLSWNDAGLGWLAGSAPLLAICLAPPKSRTALRARWDRLAGHLRPDGFVDEFSAALFFHMIFYPEAGGETASPSPLQICDPLHGMWIARNKCEDQLDAVAGAYARAFYAGGHSQHDAGSFRFSALGWDWILGGGQARGGAAWQSRLVPSDHDDNAKPGCGAVIWAPSRNDAQVFGMDLRSVHGAYSERYVALKSGPSAFLAALDIVDDHRSDRHWDWCLTFSPELSCSLGGGRFSLTAPDGVVLEAVFLLDVPEKMEIREIPASQRTFSNGQTRNYPGRPFLVARFPGPSLNILTAFRATSVKAGPIRLAAPDRFDLVADGDVWERPFGKAIPAGFTGRLAGFCKTPAPAGV
jgi:hypothetical protein